MFSLCLPPAGDMPHIHSEGVYVNHTPPFGGPSPIIMSHTHREHRGLKSGELPLLIPPSWEKNCSVQCGQWQTSAQNGSLDGRQRAVTTNCVCVWVDLHFIIARTDDGAHRFCPQSLLLRTLTHNQSKCVVSRKMEMSGGWMRIIHDTADVCRERGIKIEGWEQTEMNSLRGSVGSAAVRVFARTVNMFICIRRCLEVWNCTFCF